MKKILSFVLVLAMIASMMCISVSAGSYKIGDHTQNMGGVDANDPNAWKSHSTNITANVSTNAIPKYAIELTYSQATISVVNSATWNVNTLMYEGTTKIDVKEGENTKEYSFDSKNPTANAVVVSDIATFTVTNYSSGAITVSTAITNKLGGVDIAIANGSVDIANGSDTINAVTPVNGGRGQEVAKTYTASMKSNDWAAAFATVNDESFAIAKITFTFAAQ